MLAAPCSADLKVCSCSTSEATTVWLCCDLYLQKDCSELCLWQQCVWMMWNSVICTYPCLGSNCAGSTECNSFTFLCIYIGMACHVWYNEDTVCSSVFIQCEHTHAYNRLTDVPGSTLCLDLEAGRDGRVKEFVMSCRWLSISVKRLKMACTWELFCSCWDLRSRYCSSLDSCCCTATDGSICVLGVPS